MAGWHHRLSGHGFEQTQETAEDRGMWRAAVHGVAELDPTETERQQQHETDQEFPVPMRFAVSAKSLGLQRRHSVVTGGEESRAEEDAPWDGRSRAWALAHRAADPESSVGFCVCPCSRTQHFENMQLRVIHGLIKDRG